MINRPDFEQAGLCTEIILAAIVRRQARRMESADVPNGLRTSVEIEVIH